jgi:DNA-binding transcriptional ArsR family regulator
MPWRIHFTADDLERIEVGHTLGPLAETILALSLLRWPAARTRGLLREWPAQVKPLLTPRMRPLATLLPPGNLGVDLPTVIGQSATIEEGIVALMAATNDEMGAELEYFDRYWERLPPQAWSVVDGTGRGRIALADAAVVAYGALIAPYWTGLLAQLRAEQSLRNRILARRGGAAVLTSLQSRWIRWQPPVLEVDTPSLYGPAARGVHPGPLLLAGRGLRLVPSMFTGDFPSVHVDLQNRSAAPMVVFAATTLDRVTPSRPVPGEEPAVALARLLGRTRAVALASIGAGCSTTELAARIGTSVAGASQHASVLRAAGLIVTLRQGGAVLHTLSPLGSQLLTGALSQD